MPGFDSILSSRNALCCHLHSAVALVVAHPKVQAFAAFQLARWRSNDEASVHQDTCLCGRWRRGHGSGFCILNDLAITALELLRRGVVRRVLILDLDVHQVTRRMLLPKSALFVDS
jgi:Histone deacetylase domain